jgi:hypothetical protein
MATIEHQLTEIYCFVDDFLNTHPRLASWRRSNNAEPEFGFKLHAIIDIDGRILYAILLPANLQDRFAAEALASMVDGGVGRGDHGYLGTQFKDELAEVTDLLMITPRDAGTHKCLISTIRERIETVFSQLWARFIDRIHSRSWIGLWNTVKLKLRHNNLVTSGLLTA